MTTNRHAGYVRTSTDEQEKTGFGLDVQKEAIEMHCKLHGIELIEIIEDSGESGSTLDRPGLDRVREMIASGEIAGVVVYKLDRIARNLKDLLNLHDDEFVPRNCAMISIKEQISTDSPMGRLFFQMIGGFAEFERSVITERMMDGINNKAKTGQHATGRIALGYKKTIVNGKKAITVDETEAEIVTLIFKLREESFMTFQQIADYLNNHEYRPKRWSPEKPIKFHNSSVQVIYKNPKYRGVYTLNRYKKKKVDGKTVTELVSHLEVENEDLRILS
jgi:site-specific DNA recombinase